MAVDPGEIHIQQSIIDAQEWEINAKKNFQDIFGVLMVHTGLHRSL
jgi:hypothetical protein